MASSYRKRVTNSSRSESEFKEMIVTKTRTETLEVNKSEKGGVDLETKLINLNHRFNLLEKEKALDEKEYNQRNEANAKTIQILKEEVKALRAEFESIEIKVKETRAVNSGSNENIENKSKEIAKLKGDLRVFCDQNTELESKIREFELLVIKIKSEITKELECDVEIGYKLKEATERKIKSERLIQALEDDVEKLLREHDELKKRQGNLKAQIKAKNDAINDAERAFAENRKKISVLEVNVSECRKVNEKLQNEINLCQQEQKSESKKSAQQVAKAKALEVQIQERDEEIEELRRQLAELKEDQAGLNEDNSALVNDIKVCKNHLSLLTIENYELLEEIEKINQEDAGVRKILERDERINETKSRYEEKMKSSLIVMNTSLQSPTRSQANSATSKGSPYKF